MVVFGKHQLLYFANQIIRKREALTLEQIISFL
jgi:hypothetical protein